MNLETLVLPLEVKDGIKAAMGGIIAGVAAFTAAAGLAVAATFKWADELDQLQDVTGVTNKTAAALNFTLRKSGVSTDKLAKGMVILNKGLVKANGELDTTGEALKDWGINVKDVNGQLKDQTALIEEVSRKYSSLGTQQERVNFLTEVFGRSGAELIDFFDTLAAEGGIDKVAAKVEKLGLAIDPNRYEQFNRSLEELKLIGLGLAVSFTERVMPILEKFIDLIADPDLTFTQKIGAIAKAADNFIAGWINALTDKINNTNWQEVIDKMVAWISGIGEGPKFTTATGQAIVKLVDAIKKAITDYNWSVIGQAIADKVNEQLVKAGDSIQAAPLGAKIAIAASGVLLLLASFAQLAIVLDTVNTLFATGGFLAFLKNAPAILAYPIAGLKIIALALTSVAAAIGISTVALLGWIVAIGIAIGLIITYRKQIGELIADYGRWFRGEEVQSSWAKWLNNFEATATAGVRNFFTKWISAWSTGISNWASTVQSKIAGVVNSIIALINRIPSFKQINVQTVTTTVNKGSTGRASGGPVIAGQTYNVAEFFRPEVFTPTKSGRIDSAKASESKGVEIDYQKLASILAVELAKVVA